MDPQHVMIQYYFNVIKRTEQRDSDVNLLNYCCKIQQEIQGTSKKHAPAQ